MAFNGWMRLWVVGSVLIGLFIATLAASTQPSVTSVYESWCGYGIAKLIPAIEKAEGTTIDHPALAESLRDKGAKVCTERLRQIEAKRVDEAVSNAVAPINAEHLRNRAQFPSTVRNHWLTAFAGWLIASAVLWLIGWSVAWVRRGFSKAAV